MSQEGNKQTSVAAKLKAQKVLQVSSKQNEDAKHIAKEPLAQQGQKKPSNPVAGGKCSAAATATATTQSKLEANLHSAANEGKVELVRLLLRCGADANAQDDEFGNTALHRAAWNGFSETVQVLCKYRAITSIKNKAQFTPLHMACQQGHNQTVRLLLMANARFEAKNNYGDTPLHTAARYGHAGAARILLSAKCNPNLVNKNHDTPLHIAAAMGRRKLTKILVQNGAELAIKNKQNETAMDIALRKDLIDIQELIANPPPVKPSSRRDQNLRCANDNLHLSELELRYGQLYGGGPLQLQADQQLPTAMQIIRQQQHLQAQQNHHKRPHGHNQQSVAAKALDKDHRYRQSCDDLSSGGCDNTQSRSRTRLGQATPDESKMVQQNSNVRLVSARSMAALVSNATGGRARSAHKKPHHRTMTLASGAADLHLVPALCHFTGNSASSTRRPATARRISSAEPQGLVSTGEERDDSERSRGIACPPDARPTEWTLGMLTAPAPIPASSTHLLIEEQEPLNRREPAAQNQEEPDKSWEKSNKSPVASLRSSAAGSRKSARNSRRLPVKRQRAGYRHRSSLLIKRGNMGKLTLLRLRNMVNNRRQQNQPVEAAAKDAPQSEKEQETEFEDVEENRITDGERRPAAGRRQERLERLSRGDGSGDGAALRAPNGTKLLATRPLASLNDDTQLYAVPRKPKANDKQAPVSCNAPAGGELPAAPSPGDLTTPKSALSEDPCTPGYSTIRERSVDKLQQQSDAPPCSCGDHNERKVDVSDTDPPINKSSQQQVKQTKQQQVLANKPTSKFRQLFGHHGDSTAATNGTDQQQTVKTKSSWLKSKFSLSSNNLAAARDASPEKFNKETNGSAADRSSISADSMSANGQQDSEERTVRPKSAISQSNAELIAAQKSLAAAAAAKVKRDRQYKISLSDHQHMIPAAQITASAGTQGVLTVKTSEPNFWAHHQPLVMAAGNQVGGKYMHSLMLNGHHQRSGTNSVGMSDSSPSNNGAESDNSIQTTTGSLNTDNTSSGTAADPQQPEGPLGILSRILLNNKGLGALRAPSIDNQKSTRAEQPADSSGSTTLRNASISSSSALSSPSSDRQKVGGKIQLDQLSSRSRCPIVLSKSNELPDGDETKKSANDLPAAPVPRLPAKSALKTTQVGHHLQEQQQHIGAEALNGLPRVASYTHLPANGISEQMTRQQTLCNYHMNRQPQQSYLLYGSNHQQQPYSPYAANGFQHHLSHHDLRLISNQSAIDFNHLPASAINYEYYLDAPSSAYHLGGYQPPLGSYLHPTLTNEHTQSAVYGMTSANDDSVYISSASSTNGHTRGGNELLIGGTGKRSTALHYNLQHPSYTNDAVYQNQQHFMTGNRFTVHSQQRPKSSLDTILYSSSNVHNGNSTNPTQLSNQSAAKTDCLGRPHLDAGFSGLGEPIKQADQSLSGLQSVGRHLTSKSKPPLPTYYMASTQAMSRRQQQQAASANSASTYLYSENSIYASDQSATSFNQHSDLTVLPTTTSTDNGDSAQTSATGTTSTATTTDNNYQRSQSCTNSTSSPSPALVAATDDAAGGKDKKMVMTEVIDAATVGDQSVFVDQQQVTNGKKDETESKSRMPAAVTSTNNYRSLVQVNQSTSNQSSASRMASASNTSNTKVLMVKALDTDKRPPIASDCLDAKTSSFAAIAKQQVVISCGNNSDILRLSDDFSGSTIL